MYEVKMNERGQITIPKQLREQAKLHPNDNLKLELDGKGRIILYKKGLIDDLEDLIRRDLENEGYSGDFYKKMLERKKQLAGALMTMVKEAEQEYERGEYTSLEQLKKELDDEGLL